MSKFRLRVVCLTLATFSLSLHTAYAVQATTPNAQQSQPAPAPAPAASAQTGKVTAYTLPPDLYKKARERSRIKKSLLSFLQRS